MPFTEMLLDPYMGAVDLICIRETAGVDDYGRLSKTATETLSFIGLVQPMPGDEAALLEAAEQGKHGIIIYTNYLLYAAPVEGADDERMGDKVVYDGDTYKVVKVEVWRAFDSYHYEATAIKEI